MVPTIGLNSGYTQDSYLLNRGPSGTYNGSTPTMAHWVSAHGWILKCEARLNDGSTLRLSGYLIIPVRKSRTWIGMEGPAVIRYGSSGTNPIFYDSALGIIDIDGEINYNYRDVNVRTLYESTDSVPSSFTFDGHTAPYAWDGHVIVEGVNSPTELQYLKNYYPTCVLDTDDNRKHLRPKAMYYHNVEYSLYLWFQYDGDLHWSQPILVLLDPYGNKLLNN